MILSIYIYMCVCVYVCVRAWVLVYKISIFVMMESDGQLSIMTCTVICLLHVGENQTKKQYLCYQHDSDSKSVVSPLKETSAEDENSGTLI
jgi:hypothetical protein